MAVLILRSSPFLRYVCLLMVMTDGSVDPKIFPVSPLCVSTDGDD